MHARNLERRPEAGGARRRRAQRHAPPRRGARRRRNIKFSQWLRRAKSRTPRRTWKSDRSPRVRFRRERRRGGVFFATCDETGSTCTTFNRSKLNRNSETVAFCDGLIWANCPGFGPSWAERPGDCNLQTPNAANADSALASFRPSAVANENSAFGWVLDAWDRVERGVVA
jgi:hypothetical protein